MWIFILTGLVGSGGLVAWSRARSEAPKLAAEAQSTVIKDLNAENERLKELILEEREERQAEQAVARAQIEALNAQINAMRKRILALEKGNKPQ